MTGSQVTGYPSCTYTGLQVCLLLTQAMDGATVPTQQIMGGVFEEGGRDREQEEIF